MPTPEETEQALAQAQARLAHLEEIGSGESLVAGMVRAAVRILDDRLEGQE